MRNCISLHACFRLLSCMLLTGFFLSFSQASIARENTGKISSAFDKTITGRVTDGSNGAGLAGASVAVKGSSSSALTDGMGNYSISVSNEKAVLVVSFVGYVGQEVVVGSRTSVDFSLQSVSTDLTQVVVVGYGTQRKRDVTGAVKSVGAEEFNKGIINAPQQLLQGKVAGVNVTSASGEPGAAQGISIRGPGGVRTGSTPLFVVDGLPLDNSSTGGGDPLNFINPADLQQPEDLCTFYILSNRAPAK